MSSEGTGISGTDFTFTEDEQSEPEKSGVSASPSVLHPGPDPQPCLKEPRERVRTEGSSLGSDSWHQAPARREASFLQGGGRLLCVRNGVLFLPPSVTAEPFWRTLSWPFCPSQAGLVQVLPEGWSPERGQGGAAGRRGWGLL